MNQVKIILLHPVASYVNVTKKREPWINLELELLYCLYGGECFNCNLNRLLYSTNNLAYFHVNKRLNLACINTCKNCILNSSCIA